jgi:hypothetical protein
MMRSRGNRFQVHPEHQPLMRMIGLDADGVFSDPRVIAWRTLSDRENCTLDAETADGRRVRLHIKRYLPARGSALPADAEVSGYHRLQQSQIPTAPLVGWGSIKDGRSFTLWQDLAGFTPADKLIEGGTAFDRLLEPTADLAARLHNARLHHRDLYLCHFMARLADSVEVRLIDTARVKRLGRWFSERWIVKDLSQFWYSTLSLPISDEQRIAWLQRYASQRRDESLAAKLRLAILSKVRRIARHDRRLRASQPHRNISIPAARAAEARIPSTGKSLTSNL